MNPSKFTTPLLVIGALVSLGIANPISKDDFQKLKSDVQEIKALLLFHLPRIACSTGQIVDGSFCKDCPSGKVPNLATNDCQSCPNDHVEIGGTCKKCPSGEIPNKGGNGCQACPIDHAETRDGACSRCPSEHVANKAKKACVPCRPDYQEISGICWPKK